MHPKRGLRPGGGGRMWSLNPLNSASDRGGGGRTTYPRAIFGQIIHVKKSSAPSAQLKKILGAYGATAHTYDVA